MRFQRDATSLFQGQVALTSLPSEGNQSGDDEGALVNDDPLPAARRPLRTRQSLAPPPPQPVVYCFRYLRMSWLARWSVMGRKDYNEALITVVKLTGVLQAFSGPARAPQARRLLNLDRVGEPSGWWPGVPSRIQDTCCSHGGVLTSLTRPRLACTDTMQRSGLRGRSARA